MPRCRIDMAPTLTPLPLLAALALLLGAPLCTHATGYSYARFVGPVRGPEQQILVRDALNGAASVDFIAKPAYEFAYGVEDGRTRVLQNRHETRDGDEVKGVYSVVDPDGNLRVVKYTSDHINGFRAEVITNGLAEAVQSQSTQHTQDLGDVDPVQHYVKAGPHQEQEVIHHTDGNVGGGDYEVTEPYERVQIQQQKQPAPVEESNAAQAENEKDEEDEEDEEETEEHGEYEDEASREAQSNEESSNEY